MDGGSVFATLLFVGAVMCPAATVLMPSIIGETMMGIDLGTTYSVVALCHRGVADPVPVDGFNTTPSVVYFDPSNGARVVGREAATMRAMAPDRTVFDAKRIIGRNLTTDQLALEESSVLPYSVTNLGNGSIGIDIPGLEIQTPQSVGTTVLSKLKRAAETSTWWRKVSGHKFTSATISVPVSFTLAQRAATVKAGEAAGFRMVRVLEEPVAAAIAYALLVQNCGEVEHFQLASRSSSQISRCHTGLHRGSSERTVLVYDMGGGTLDVALMQLELRTRTFLVLGATGDPHLGGEDFDRALASHLISADDRLQQSAEAPGNINPGLLQAVEVAKRKLSHSESAEVPLPMNPPLSISRDMLEDACAPLLMAAMEPVYSVLRETDTHPDAVHDVVMVGGSSRLLAVRRRLNIFFGGKLRTNDVDPDTAIAVGSALSFGC